MSVFISEVCDMQSTFVLTTFLTWFLSKLSSIWFSTATVLFFFVIMVWRSRFICCSQHIYDRNWHSTSCPLSGYRYACRTLSGFTCTEHLNFLQTLKTTFTPTLNWLWNTNKQSYFLNLNMIRSGTHYKTKIPLMKPNGRWKH